VTTKLKTIKLGETRAYEVDDVTVVIKRVDA
jgi:hypothetical protein